MVRLSAITLDTARQTGGVWTPDPWGKGFEFLIASADSPEFKAAVVEAYRMRDDPARSEKDVRDAVSRAIAKYLLRDWRGIERDDSDEPLPYSFERALDYMTLPEFAHLRAWVESVAGTTERYFRTTADAAGKG